MTPDAPSEPPVRARRVPKDDVGPESVVERQESLSVYLMHRAERRRQRFLQRSRTTTIRGELLRAGYLTGCLLLDFLIIPEPIFLLPGTLGWGLAAVLFFIAVGAEGWFYSKHFALKEEPETGPEET